MAQQITIEKSIEDGLRALAAEHAKYMAEVEAAEEYDRIAAQYVRQYRP
jgi:hypothetical protein